MFYFDSKLLLFQLTGFAFFEFYKMYAPCINMNSEDEGKRKCIYLLRHTTFPAATRYHQLNQHRNNLCRFMDDLWEYIAAYIYFPCLPKKMELPRTW